MNFPKKAMKAAALIAVLLSCGLILVATSGRTFSLILVGILAVLLALLIRAVRDALSNSEHVFRDPCITPAETLRNILYLMRGFKKIMDGKGVTYWIDYGTLLGAYRRGSFLPWDHDADLCYLEEDRPRIDAAREEFEALGIELNLPRYGIFYRGTKVDLEPWRVYGDRLCRSDPARRSGIQQWYDAHFDDFPREWIQPLWSIEFAGEMYPCPNHPDRLLRRRYPTHRLHPRLSFPHKQRCWFSLDFWKLSYRIFRTQYEPVVGAWANQGEAKK